VKGSDGSIWAFGDAATIDQPRALQRADELFEKADVDKVGVGGDLVDLASSDGMHRGCLNLALRTASAWQHKHPDGHSKHNMFTVSPAVFLHRACFFAVVILKAPGACHLVLL
jgi:hypothetical protein